MNELDLFFRWFKEQDKYVIKKRRDYDYSGNVSNTTVLNAYKADRDYTIVKEIIMKHVKDAKNNQYSTDENVANNIIRDIRKLKQDAF